MTSASQNWYYKDPDSADVVGPLNLSQLTALVRNGDLPDDVFISRGGENWAYADSVTEFLHALPLDRDRVIREYLEYGARSVQNGDWGDWGWASDRMWHIIPGAPEIAWELITHLIDVAPTDHAGGFFAAGPLENFLSEHGPQFIERVEERARENPIFREALRGMYPLFMTDDVWTRLQRAAGEPPLCRS